MTTIRAIGAGLALFLALCPLAVNGAPVGRVSPFVQRSIAPGLTREAFSARVLAVFDRLDAGGDGVVDASDALAYAQGEAAAARAANAGRLLAFDLDGDGRVDRAELAAGLRRGLALPDAVASSRGDDVAGAAEAILIILDANADGRIDLREMLAIPVPEAVANPVVAFLDAFPTADGRLTREAFLTGMLAQAFDAADRDRNGVLSEAEVEAVR